MKIFNSFLLLLISFAFCGCAGVMNPYEEEFGCPGGDYGSCTDVTKAYDKSFQENDESFSPMVKVNIGPRVNVSENHSTPGSGGDNDERVGVGEGTTNSGSVTVAGSGTSGISGNGEIYDHQKALLTELQGVIADEKTPMLVPSKQMRLLVLGYEDDHMSYYGHRYVYFIAEPERWVLPTNRIGIPLQRTETLFRQ